MEPVNLGEIAARSSEALLRLCKHGCRRRSGCAWSLLALGVSVSSTLRTTPRTWKAAPGWLKLLGGTQAWTAGRNAPALTTWIRSARL